MDIDDIVAFGGELTVPSLLHAYRNGIFPWPIEGVDELPWFCPRKRALLFFSELKITASLRKFVRRIERREIPWSFTLNQSFDAVVAACADRKQEGTWITPEMAQAYSLLRKTGNALSVEVWNSSTQSLVGGLYGVFVDGVFSGESMFHRESNASKIAVLALIAKLRELGLEWIDIQQLTPHFESLGAREISRKNYLSQLKESQEKHRSRGAPVLDGGFEGVTLLRSPSGRE